MPRKKVAEPDQSRSVWLRDVEFGVAEQVGTMPLMRFARYARNGIEASDYEGMAAMYDLLKACITPADWSRFEVTADELRVDGDELFGVVKDAFSVLAGRPTSRPSVSSDGPRSTSPSSTGDSSSRVIRRLEEQGRPDLALLVSQHAAAS